MAERIPGSPLRPPASGPADAGRAASAIDCNEVPSVRRAWSVEAGEQPGHHVLDDGLAASREFAAIRREPVQDRLAKTGPALEQPSPFEAGDHRARGLIGLPGEQRQRVGRGIGLVREGKW